MGIKEKKILMSLGSSTFSNVEYFLTKDEITEEDISNIVNDMEKLHTMIELIYGIDPRILDENGASKGQVDAMFKNINKIAKALDIDIYQKEETVPQYTPPLKKVDAPAQQPVAKTYTKKATIPTKKAPEGVETPVCTSCGEIDKVTYHKSGTGKNGKEWHRFTCSDCKEDFNGRQDNVAMMVYEN